ncbi:MAG: transketolase [bacterium]|nr:transketolase [bacterium]
MNKINDIRAINDIRMLALDMINTSGSGHPGIVLGATPLIYTIYKNHLNFQVDNPTNFNRDRFILSAGHGSAMLYATLFLMGYNYSIDDLKKFRQLKSITPGHPELNPKLGIETTTGPLGQGLGTAVGMAIASKYLNLNNKIYVLCGDGDLMEGISYEATSLAGTLNLDNLIILYDSNNICLDGKTNKTFNDNIKQRFNSVNFNYILVEDTSNLDSLNKAIEQAKIANKPTIIEIKTIIGKYSKYENTNQVHGSPLSLDDLTNIRKTIGFSNKEFSYDEENTNNLRKYIKQRVKLEDSNYSVVPCNLIYEDINIDKNTTMRDINKSILNYISNKITLLGGSADVVSSTKTYLIDKGEFSKDNYQGQNIYFGVRESLMASCLNGIALTNIKCFGSCFLTFSDYLKESLRLSALMNLPVIYIFTHDSIEIGQDGPTHQPIEQLTTLRSIPNLNVYRPADSKELVGAYQNILNNNHPAVLIISRDKTNESLDTSSCLVTKGGYIISEFTNKQDLIIVASGKEVSLAIDIKEALDLDIRVVSMPNLNIFLNQDDNYKEMILPTDIPKVIIEYSNDPLWYKLMNNQDIIFNIQTFGASGKKTDIVKHYQLDIKSIINKINDTYQ